MEVELYFSTLCVHVPVIMLPEPSAVAEGDASNSINSCLPEWDLKTVR